MLRIVGERIVEWEKGVCRLTRAPKFDSIVLDRQEWKDARGIYSTMVKLDDRNLDTCPLEARVDCTKRPSMDNFRFGPLTDRPLTTKSRSPNRPQISRMRIIT
ncbi:hypothetical protein T01_6977 [Trichinella spiralis]|nr:hypothetical protein T01_6977 [Trichinella spiralis]